MYHPKHAAAAVRPARRKKIWPVIVGSVLGVILAAYALFVFAPFSGIRYWRDIYIETAMTTQHHKWLATAFIPARIIDGVMAQQSKASDTVGGLDVQPVFPAEEETASVPQTASSSPSSSSSSPAAGEEPDILGQKMLTAGEKNSFGDLVETNDIKQGVVIIKVTGKNYVSHLALIDDPARVFLAFTSAKGSSGTFICDYLKKYDAILGVNASGFVDFEGKGSGGEVVGRCCSRGKMWGDYIEEYDSFGFDASNRLLVGKIDDWKAYGIRDGAQFNPALIIDRKVVTAGTNGWGLQPRTCIGQRSDGAVLLLVVDGRQVGYSLGATVGDCAEILEKYGAVNAACCDGGSSSILAYDGKLRTIPSTPQKSTGRWLPNAFLVAKR